MRFRCYKKNSGVKCRLLSLSVFEIQSLNKCDFHNCRIYIKLKTVKTKCSEYTDGKTIIFKVIYTSLSDLLLFLLILQINNPVVYEKTRRKFFGTIYLME